MAATKKKGKPAAKPRAKGMQKAATKKGRRDDSFVAFVVGQLDSLGGVRSKSMFGAHGLYSRETFFGIIDDGRLYFRVDDTTRPRYQALGMKPFMPDASMTMKAYYEVPLDVIEDAAELARWGRDAVGAAPKKKSAARPAGRPG